MDEVIKFADYKQFNEAFGREYGRQAEGFVRMGYMLKYARDTNILYESGYKSVAEYAYGEYKLPDYTVTNMIKINDRYSEGGYSDRLADRYRGFGSSLLAEMLTLSDAVIDALPPGTKREEIREIKNEIKEEQKVTDLEVMLEEPEQQGAENNLEKVIRKYYYDNRQQYRELHSLILEGGPTEQEAVDLLAPYGTAVKFARVSGVGKFMMSIKGEDQEIEILNVRTNETEKYSWEACVKALKRLYRGSRESRKDWEFIYGEPFQEDEHGKEDYKKSDHENDGPGHRSAEKADEKTKQAKREKNEERTVKKEDAPAQPEEKSVPIMPEPITEDQQDDAEEEQQAVQQSIESYEDVLPEGYHSEPEVITRKEVELWKEAAQSAVRLFNTLEGNDWNPDCIKLVHEMCMETANLKIILENLEELMEHSE